MLIWLTSTYEEMDNGNAGEGHQYGDPNSPGEWCQKLELRHSALRLFQNYRCSFGHKRLCKVNDTRSFRGNAEGCQCDVCVLKEYELKVVNKIGKLKKE